MIEFKSGDKVRYTGNAFYKFTEAKVGETGEVLRSTGLSAEVRFERSEKTLFCDNVNLELAEPTTLEKMKEEIKECETCEHAYILKPCTTYPIPKSCWACKSGVPHRTEYKLKIAEPTTLERLAELEKSGEEFEINKCDGKYSFVSEKLTVNELDSMLVLNYIISNGIKEMPWMPKEGETFYVITIVGIITPFIFNPDNDTIKSLIETGNFFRTKELAEAVGIAKILKEANHG